MTELNWLILIIWFGLLAFAYNRDDKLFKVSAAFVGILVGIFLANEALDMAKYAGLGVMLLNFYIALSTIFKR